MLCVVDPDRSVFHRHFADRSVTTVEGPTSCIEGIGRPRVEPSFVPELVDRMVAVPDEPSLAAMRVLGERLGRRCGGSTGTNLWGCAVLVSEMAACGETGSIVSLLCDPGERYLESFFDDGWIRERGLELGPCRERVEAFFDRGEPLPAR
jgi:cysteine synthase A